MLLSLTRLKRVLALAVLLSALLGYVAVTGATSTALAATADQNLQAKIVEYKKKLAEYRKARDAYDKAVAPYWRTVTAKRGERRKKFAANQRVTLADYVLEQPKLYAGPQEPDNPEKKPSEPRVIPVADDFLLNAKEQFGFTPQLPASEIDYKRAYARAATAAGLTKVQCVKIYGFESGGDGGYDVQAGREYDKHARVISTALGYNQLLTTNSVELVAEAGDGILAELAKKADRAEGERKAELQAKIAALEKMQKFSRTVPDDWSAHGRLAGTPKGIGMHALILDVDIGPLLQTQKLLTSVNFAKRKGIDKPLTAAELEMMNLTGDGNGYDMVQMPAEMREKVPTSNFFQQGGYERNPVAIHNNTVAKLLAATDAKMIKEANLQGAKDLAAAFDAAAGHAASAPATAPAHVPAPVPAHPTAQ
jgi:hypothetical protein